MTEHTKRPARTTRVLDRSVREGAVNQDGSLPLYRCNACGSEVVWATSRRTGRKYLVNVTDNGRSRYYMKHNVHRCEDVLREREEWRAFDERQAAKRAWQERAGERGGRLVPLVHAQIDAEIAGDADEAARLQAEIDAIQAETAADPDPAPETGWVR